MTGLTAGEPSSAEIEAAAKAMRRSLGSRYVIDPMGELNDRDAARAALIAARSVAPLEPNALAAPSEIDTLAARAGARAEFMLVVDKAYPMPTFNAGWDAALAWRAALSESPVEATPSEG